MRTLRPAVPLHTLVVARWIRYLDVVIHMVVASKTSAIQVVYVTFMSVGCAVMTEQGLCCLEWGEKRAERQGHKDTK